MPIEMTRWRRGGAAVLASALSLAVLAACGGGSDNEAAAPTQEQPAATASVRQDGRESGRPETVRVGESFWHAGWRVTLGDATFTPGNRGGEVAIEAAFENLGESPAVFDSQLVLIAGSENYDEETLDQELPRVPGGLTGDGLITFRVDAEFSFEGATLIVGNPANNQARVPLDGGDGLVTLKPHDVAVTGSITAGAVTAAVEGAEVRADMPEKHSIVEKGRKLVIVRFSVTPQTGIRIGEGLITSANLVLKLPDGTAVAVCDDGVSGVNELLQGREGTTIDGLSVRFEVDEPVAGEYRFVLRGKYGPGGADVEAELPLTIATTEETSAVAR